MNKRKAQLEIRLRSDLCAGSGMSVEGSVDADVFYTAEGVPCIPARRLKGCLRDAAGLIRLDGDLIRQIFGTGGNDRPAGLLLGNAYPEGYEELQKDLEAAAKDPAKAGLVRPLRILEQYTSVKAQTKIERKSGTADDTTMRFTRTVSHYDPLETEKEMVFRADVTYDASLETVLSDLALALRHIGMDRNRGLGNVSCRLVGCRDAVPVDVRPASGDTSWCSLRIVLRNRQPLMLSAGNDSRTEGFIGGQTLRGALAAAYLEESGDDGNSDAFSDLFLNGRVSFGPLYVTEKIKDGETADAYPETLPAPLFLRKMKKTGEIISAGALKDGAVRAGGRVIETAGGNMPKTLRGMYTAFMEDGSLHVFEPDTEIVYHHSKRTANARNASEDGLLYTFEVLRPGQFFTGTITGERRYLDVILRLMRREEGLRIGKSRSAQYGQCVLAAAGTPSPMAEQVFVKKGEEILVVLESDAVFVKDQEDGTAAVYTDRYADISPLLAKAIGMPGAMVPEENRSALQVGVSFGYQAAWNLKKPSIPLVRAGSVFHYLVPADTLVTLRAGERRAEGYGRLRIFRASDLPEIYAPGTVETGPAGGAKLSPLVDRIAYDMLLERIRGKALQGGRIGIGPAALGRVTLMLEESRDYGDFAARVNSIKGQAKTSVCRFLRGHFEKEQTPAFDPYRFTKDPAMAALLLKDWKKIIEFWLVNEKYELKLESLEKGGKA